MENITNGSNKQSNSNRIVYNIITASLSKGHFCLLSKQTYWGSQPKAVKDTLGSLAYLVIFGAKRSQVMLVENLASASKEL